MSARVVWMAFPISGTGLRGGMLVAPEDENDITVMS